MIFQQRQCIVGSERPFFERSLSKCQVPRFTFGPEQFRLSFRPTVKQWHSGREEHLPRTQLLQLFQPPGLGSLSTEFRGTEIPRRKVEDRHAQYLTLLRDSRQKIVFFGTDAA